MSPRLADLCCLAGGATKGYQMAGFHVTGVDLVASPNYCGDEFVQADALTFDLSDFDAVHASPPCQLYSRLAAMHPELVYPDLIPAMREKLIASGLPFVMENVESAPLQRQPGLFGLHGFLLCGTAFGLGARGMDLRRHRLFETNLHFPAAPPCRHRLKTIGVYGHGGHSGKHRMAYAAEAREAMGIDWMSRDEMCEAIPPAYTQWIGAHLMAELESRVA